MINRSKKERQPFQDGFLRIYAVENVAEPGDAPRTGLTLKEGLRYDERTVGLNRMVAMQQEGVRIAYLLRCPLRRNVSAQDIAVPNDGLFYKIANILYPEDIEPKVMDITLQATAQNYRIAEVQHGAQTE